MIPLGSVIRRSRSACAIALGLALAGCGSLFGPEKAAQIYSLNPSLGAPATAIEKQVRWQISVAVPEADATRDSERIALSLSSNTMDYYAGAAWPDRAPLLVQGLLVRAFENTGRTPAVARDSAGIGADYILQTELRAFEARYDAPDAAPRVVVEISAKLTTMPERKIIGAHVAREEVQASANNLNAVVEAFNTAVAPAVNGIAAWALKSAPE